LLTLARADAHTLTSHRTVMDFSMLANTVIDQVISIAEQKNITLQREIAGKICLEADEDRMIQLALNLIENAVKYTPEGGIVTVTAAQIHHQVCFTVADTGPGIAPEHLSHIFDRFYRMDRSRSRDQGGFGLGLAIAQQIAQLHGGEITVASQVGIGTQFSVTLPTS
jgi:signal transduction histidine kinase